MTPPDDAGLTDSDYEQLAAFAAESDRANGATTPVAESGSGKPDPSEPWRWVCPACDGQVHGAKRGIRKYQCSSCRQTWDRDDLKDRKEAD